MASVGASPPGAPVTSLAPGMPVPSGAPSPTGGAVSPPVAVSPPGAGGAPSSERSHRSQLDLWGNRRRVRTLPDLHHLCVDGEGSEEESDEGGLGKHRVVGSRGGYVGGYGGMKRRKRKWTFGVG